MIAVELRSSNRPLLALGVLAVPVLALAAGVLAPFDRGLLFDQAGLPALALGALALYSLRFGLATSSPFEWAADQLRALDARRLRVPYALFVAVVGYAAVRRFEVFEAHAYDLAIFDQAIWSTTQGHFLFSSIKGDIVLLGDHVSPIVAAFALLYRVVNDVRVLLVAQAAILGLGAFPVLRLARRAVGPGAIAGLLPLVYLVSAPVRHIALRDFHPECVAVPAVLWAIVALHERRWGLLAACAALTASCKESSALALVGLGLYALFINRERWAAAALAVAGVAVFAIDVLVVMPHYAGSGTPYVGRYAHLGAGMGEVLLAPVKRPFYTLSRLVWPTVKLEGLGRLLAPYGGLALLAPVALLAAAPNYLVNAMAAYSPMHNVNWHYHAEMAAFVAAASVLGCAAALRRWPSARAPIAIWVATLAVAQVGRPELARLQQSHVTPRMERIAAHLARVPDGAAIAADTVSATHLAHRLHLYHFPNRTSEADYVVVDTTVREHQWHVPMGWTPQPELRELEQADFERIVDDDGFVILRRREVGAGLGRMGAREGERQ